jgi:CheY-like chemotaxis protein/anti-sigma regulatory factor (Ser/Thr protein kinase)
MLSRPPLVEAFFPTPQEAAKACHPAPPFPDCVVPLSKESNVIKVLVVDDALADRALVSGLIAKRLESTLLEAADGRQALALIEAHRPDLVVTDLQMPEMNGLELVTAVKENFPDIPVLLMTARGSEEIAAQALQRGAASYVPKRRLADDLVRTVERVLSTARQERSRSLLMHHVTASDTTFVLPNDADLLRLLVSHLLTVLRCLPLGDETERLRVGIALEEALANAYYHGNLQLAADGDGRDRKRYEELARQRALEPPYRDRQIHVRARISRAEAVFVIRDEGPGFDTARLAAATALAEGEQGYGRGILLMRTVMDEVTYNAAGNEVTLVKRAVLPEEGPADVGD